MIEQLGHKFAVLDWDTPRRTAQTPAAAPTAAPAPAPAPKK